MMMLSNNQKKLIVAMSQKKQRDKHGLFLAEGPKIVNDLLAAGMNPILLAATQNWEVPDLSGKTTSPVLITHKELNQLSLLKTPKDVLGLFPQIKSSFNNNAINNQLALVLDGIQDPGNMGTIVRIADWFGFGYIICSSDTVDIYNPKVVQATMGAIARVKVLYTELKEFIAQYKKETENPVYGTYPDKKTIYFSSLLPKGLIVMGNEGNGIRPAVSELVTEKITIPSNMNINPASESLNVGVATAIICSEFLRQTDYSSRNPSD